MEILLNIDSDVSLDSPIVSTADERADSSRSEHDANLISWSLAWAEEANASLRVPDGIARDGIVTGQAGSMFDVLDPPLPPNCSLANSLSPLSMTEEREIGRELGALEELDPCWFAEWEEFLGSMEAGESADPGAIYPSD